MIKLAVGVDDLAHLAQIQEHYRVRYLGDWAVPIRTRLKPAKANDILNGGSIYRVVKGRIQCRQEVLGFEEAQSADRGTQCLIMASCTLMQTISVPHRPFQGWRYLDSLKAPADLGIFDPEQHAEIPEEISSDLHSAGLI
jgi:hypothetical protein